eukprot:gnl/Dysnectes_brevis/811_a896_5054.p1 GENE.gnl/Dysnectes_brevis/811_a896_5054~~gnl/Dysnectes_brevis/811_a896_5054.p1  ORF type:complete len:109 (+),score=8.08 gnl/Dysnectes_brevis/811_a896_5054:34-360(+)
MTHDIEGTRPAVQSPEALHALVPPLEEAQKLRGLHDLLHSAVQLAQLTVVVALVQVVVAGSADRDGGHQVVLVLMFERIALVDLLGNKMMLGELGSATAERAFRHFGR